MRLSPNCALDPCPGPGIQLVLNNRFLIRKIKSHSVGMKERQVLSRVQNQAQLSGPKGLKHSQIPAPSPQAPSKATIPPSLWILTSSCANLRATLPMEHGPPFPPLDRRVLEDTGWPSSHQGVLVYSQVVLFQPGLKRS